MGFFEEKLFWPKKEKEPEPVKKKVGIENIPDPIKKYALGHVSLTPEEIEKAKREGNLVEMQQKIKRADARVTTDNLEKARDEAYGLSAEDDPEGEKLVEQFMDPRFKKQMEARRLNREPRGNERAA